MVTLTVGSMYHEDAPAFIRETIMPNAAQELDHIEFEDSGMTKIYGRYLTVYVSALSSNDYSALIKRSEFDQGFCEILAQFRESYNGDSPEHIEAVLGKVYTQILTTSTSTAVYAGAWDLYQHIYSLTVGQMASLIPNAEEWDLILKEAGTSEEDNNMVINGDENQDTEDTNGPAERRVEGRDGFSETILYWCPICNNDPTSRHQGTDYWSSMVRHMQNKHQTNDITRVLRVQRA